MYRYYKVVSAQADASCRVSCLIFDEKPYYWFEPQLHMLYFPGDGTLGEFDFKPMWVDSILTKCFKDKNDFEAIDEDLFNLELCCLGQKIAGMPWSAEHYRCGGKLPTDEGWIKEEN